MTPLLPRPVCSEFVELSGRVPCTERAVDVATLTCPHGCELSPSYLCPDHSGRLRAAAALGAAIHCAPCHQQPGELGHCCPLHVAVTTLEV